MKKILTIVIIITSYILVGISMYKAGEAKGYIEGYKEGGNVWHMEIIPRVLNEAPDTTYIPIDTGNFPLDIYFDDSTYQADTLEIDEL